MKAFLVTALGPQDAAEDADDYGHGRGFRWSARPPWESNSDEEDLHKNGQAASVLGAIASPHNWGCWGAD
jgi:hypothetical protein